MKKILIAGANSYIGTSLEEWLKKYPSDYYIDTLDMRDGSWNVKDFSKYDVVFHVAGIAHVSSDPKMEALYYKVNRDLTIETAKKAKAEGVGQFIFMSSIIVYGASAKMGEKKVITRDTLPAPVGAYGDSKLQAEKGIEPLGDNSFNVCILRPPMIYGPGCKGNYPLLSKAARKLPFFPDIDNQRSMLFIENLCSAVKHVIDTASGGLILPQNDQYVRTSEMVKLIADAHNQKIILVRILNPLLKLLSKRIEVINRIFGNLVYVQEPGAIPVPLDFKSSIFITEAGNKK